MSFREALQTREEENALARQMALAYEGMVQFYRREFGLTVEEADARAANTLTPGDQARIMNTPPDQVNWNDLGRLLKADPQQGFVVWERIKQSARDELQTGHRAAAALEFDSAPMARAQFLMLREELSRSWQPHDGIELTLIDMLAQSYTSYLFWLERLNMLSTGEVKVAKDKYKREGYCEPPRVTALEARAEAAAMVERWSRLFMRTLRGLRDLRRWSSPVTINNSGGQLNIGTQVNAAQVDTRTDD